MPALEGLRILDMTQYEAGTSCTQCLAWLGADVVKVEPVTGDPSRGDTGNSEYFCMWNSNKRSIAVDLRSERGKDLLLQMVPHYDVFIENYGPGVIEKLDIGYDVMKALHPGIIYARIKGFGLDGPWANYKCFDMVAQAAAGSVLNYRRARWSTYATGANNCRFGNGRTNGVVDFSCLCTEAQDQGRASSSNFPCRKP